MNLILACETQKILGHNLLSDNFGTQFYMRAKKDIVFVGLSYLMQKTLSLAITQEDIDEATAVLKERGQLDGFDMSRWQYIVDRYNGLLPITIRSREEGEFVKARDVIMVVDIWDENVSWLSYHLDSMILRAIWYPSTLTTRLVELKSELKKWGSLNPLITTDIAGRIAATSEASTIMSACVHTVFPNSDSLAGEEYLKRYYGHSSIKKKSIYETEHNIVMGWSSEDEYLEKLKRIKAGSAITCLIDTYNKHHCLNILLSDSVMSLAAKRNITMIVTPDSVERAIETISVMRYMLAALDCKSSLPRHLKVTQNGLTVKTLRVLQKYTERHGIDPNNFVFTFEDNLLQDGISRGTYGFEFKMCAQQDKAGWVGTQKKPRNDSDSWSLKGYQWSILLETRYINGFTTYLPTLSDVRSNLATSLSDLARVISHK
ncbi:MAG: nicotinamide phosphoribosyltransferase domain-containing protein [Vibrio splendidus]